MNQKEVLENDKLKEKFISLLNNSIHFDKVNWKRIKPDLMSELEKLKVKIDYNKPKDNLNHESIDLSELENEIIEEIISKYYIEEKLMKLEDEDIEKIQESDTNHLIYVLLKNDDIKIIEIGLLIMIDCKIDYNSI